MTQSELFEALGAPLVNVRWSWGAVREADGAVILRVWEDGVGTRDGREYVSIWRDGRTIGPRDHGSRERARHVDRIKTGAPCLLVMCEAVDPDARPRRVRRFNSEQVFPGGALQQRGDSWWIERLPRISLKEAARPGQRR